LAESGLEICRVSFVRSNELDVLKDEAQHQGPLADFLIVIVHSIMWNDASLLSTSVRKLYFKSSSPCATHKNETWVVLRIGMLLFVERVPLFREMLGTLVQTYISSTAYYHTEMEIRAVKRPSMEKINSCLSKHPNVIFSIYKRQKEALIVTLDCVSEDACTKAERELFRDIDPNMIVETPQIVVKRTRKS